MTRKNTFLRMLLSVALIAATFFFGAAPTAQAASPDKTLVMDSYLNAFYNANNGNAFFYADSARSTRGSFWQSAEEIELVEDAAASNSKYNPIVTALCNGFLSVYGTDWTGNSFNDDILWASLAFTRTGNPTFISIARNNFLAVWNRAYDTTLIPGLWWTTGKTSKNACVNGEGAIVAYLLGYTSYANTLWNGFLSNPKVCDLSKYRIADHINSDGSVVWWEFTYNQGVLLGAATYLGHLTAARAAMQETLNALTYSSGVPFVEGTGNNDAAGFKGVWTRWAALYAKQDSAFNLWLDRNANQAWNERNSNGLVCSDWTQRTSDGVVTAWECSSGAAILLNDPIVGVTPAAPVGLNAASGNLEVTLSWQACGGAASYNVYRGTMAGGESAVPLAVGVTGASYTDAGCADGATYYYKVAAVNGAGTSAPSSEVRAVPNVYTQLNLSSAAHSPGIYNDGATFPNSDGLDGAGNACSGALIGTSQTWNSVPFALGAAGYNNVITGAGQTIALPAGKFAALYLMATAVSGSQTAQNFKVNYASGGSVSYTQSISDWRSPQNYFGESQAVAMRYFNASNGAAQAGSCSLYGYTFALDAARAVTSLTLPNNARVKILALTLAAPVNSVSGVLSLEGVGDLAAISSSAPLGAFQFEFRTPGTLSILFAASVTLSPVGNGSPFGAFRIGNTPAGTYDIAIKGAKNLRVVKSGVVVSGATALTNTTLPAGDANGDNSVDSTDFGLLIGAFNTSAALPGSGYDAAEDFNFDGSVDSSDFGLLISNSGVVGAP